MFPLHVVSVNIPVVRFKTNRILFLTGKPVAVTSNRGTGRAPLCPGANPSWSGSITRINSLKAEQVQIISCLSAPFKDFHS